MREGFGGGGAAEDQNGAIGGIGERSGHDQLATFVGAADQVEMFGAKRGAAFDVVFDDVVNEQVVHHSEGSGRRFPLQWALEAPMWLAAILFGGILTMWVPARWAVSGFQAAIFALAAARIVARRFRIGLHPVGVVLAAVAVWGLIQAAAHWTVNQFVTLSAVLDWITNLAAFALALELARQPERRARFLDAVLVFGVLLAAISTLTLFSSPPGKIAWLFDTDTGVRTLGPFVYRNQYAAFVEAILPLGVVRAMTDRRRWPIYAAAAAVLFASVVAGASRAGTILCLAEAIAIPLIALGRGIVSGGSLARVMAGSLAALGLLTAAAGWQVVWSRLQQPDPYAQRAEMLKSSLAMIRDRPVKGFGLGTWAIAYPGYARYDDGLFVNQAHNDWAQWAAEGGVPLLLMMLAVAGMSIRPAWRSLWGLGMLAVFLHCLVDYPMQQRPALAAFFFAALGLIAAEK
jgi:O-antigen ligase